MPQDTPADSPPTRRDSPQSSSDVNEPPIDHIMALRQRIADLKQETRNSSRNLKLIEADGDETGCVKSPRNEDSVKELKKKMKQKDEEIMFLKNQIDILTSSKERMEKDFEKMIGSRDSTVSFLEDRISAQNRYVGFLEEKVVKLIGRIEGVDIDETKLIRQDSLTTVESSKTQSSRSEKQNRDDHILHAALQSKQESRRTRFLGSIKKCINRDGALLLDIQDLVDDDDEMSGDDINEKDNNLKSEK